VPWIRNQEGILGFRAETASVKWHWPVTQQRFIYRGEKGGIEFRLNESMGRM
jgi:hypothetical protein